MKPRDLISLKEIAELCNVHPSAVSNWKKRSSVDFPEPWGTWPMGSLYVRTEDCSSADDLSYENLENAVEEAWIYGLISDATNIHPNQERMELDNADH